MEHTVEGPVQSTERFENGSAKQSLDGYKFQFESLILAQDERWRRA